MGFFNFKIVSQKGSYVKLQRKLNNIKQMLIIPDHEEVDGGAPRAIFSQASKFILPIELEKYFYN